MYVSLCFFHSDTLMITNTCEKRIVRIYPEQMVLADYPVPKEPCARAPASGSRPFALHHLIRGDSSESARAIQEYDRKFMSPSPSADADIDKYRQLLLTASTDKLLDAQIILTTCADASGRYMSAMLDSGGSVSRVSAPFRREIPAERSVTFVRART